VNYNDDLAHIRENRLRKPVRLRALSSEEIEKIKELASSRELPARAVQRARVIKFLIDEPKLVATQAGLKAGFRSTSMGPEWVKRFNEKGLEGLEDQPRPGRKHIHPPNVRDLLIDLATQKPDCLGYPFQFWTLESLQCALKERYNIHLSDSTIWEWLREAGLIWKEQKSWLHSKE